MSIRKSLVATTSIGAILIGTIGGMFFVSVHPNVAKSSSVPLDRPVFTSGLHVMNQNNEVRGTLTLWDGVHPALIQNDTQCDRRISLAIYGRERTGLTLYGEDCKRRMALEVQNDVQPMFTLRDHSDNARDQVSFHSGGRSVVRVFGVNGKVEWEKP